MKGTSNYKFLQKHPERTKRFESRGFPLLVHTYFALHMWISFRNEQWWFFDCGILGVSIPTPNKKYKFIFKLIYNISFSYYVYVTSKLIFGFLFNVGIKEKFWEMFIHHVVSLSLLLYSFFSSYLEWGILLLFVHNSSDVSSYITRMFNDLNIKVVAGIFLPISWVSWIYFRLFLYPYFVISVSMCCFFKVEIYEVFLEAAGFSGVLIIFLLIALYMMSVYWVFGITKILWNIVNGILSSNSSKRKEYRSEV